MVSSCIRLTGVTGYDERTNDIIFVPSSEKRNAETQAQTDGSDVVVFFGGDVQDYPENMKSHRDHGVYVEYNLEAVAQILASKFPISSIIVVRPAKMELKTFSCFSNFVPCNHIGSPTHETNFGSVSHLAALLRTVSERTGNGEVGTSALTLIGFSKGCVVLNQFLHEFHHFQNIPPSASSTTDELLRRIRKMVWLDGGHSGGKDTWVTSPAILSSFAKMNIPVDIHVTPYQIKDDRRPWIGKEEKQFHSTLRKLGVKLSRQVYFEEEPPSFDNHFALLKSFL